MNLHYCRCKLNWILAEGSTGYTRLHPRSPIEMASWQPALLAMISASTTSPSLKRARLEATGNTLGYMRYSQIGKKNCQILKDKTHCCPTHSLKPLCIWLLYLGTGLFCHKIFLIFTNPFFFPSFFFSPTVSCIWAKNAQEFGALFTFDRWQTAKQHRSNLI